MPRFESHPGRRPTVITGASSGIGAASASMFAEAGHPVVLGARRVDRLEALAERIREAGGEAVAVELDVTDTESIERFTKVAEEAFGPPDVLVSNVGTVAGLTGMGASPAQFGELVQLNLLAGQHLAARLGPGMIERGHGDIVFVSSDVVVRPRTHMAAYVTAKAGLEAFAGVLQMELEGTGVRCGVVRPGPSNTELGTTWDEETVVRILSHWERWGHLRHGGSLLAENVAQAILTMVSVPKGTHLTLIEVEPEAPVQQDRGLL